jgi:predicted amidophosphoribosyltransferase
MCLRKWPFYSKVMVPYLYEGTLMSAIHQFKYGGKSHLAKSLGPFLASFVGERLNGMLLARHVASQLDVNLDFLSLRRIRYTQPQTGLKKDERRKNVKKAFGLMDPKVVKGRTVILVDDVTTTGNTLNECARILKRAGATNIYCAVLARTAGA